jgi:DNA-binding XRE family transcriptional regulator
VREGNEDPGDDVTPTQKLAAKKTWHRPARNKTSKARTRPVSWECRLREVRESLRLSLRDVAEAVKLSVTALHQIEHGTDPQLTTARKLATFFGRSVEMLWPTLSREV